MTGIEIDVDNINTEAWFNELENKHIDHIAELVMKRLLNDKGKLLYRRFVRERLL